MAISHVCAINVEKSLEIGFFGQKCGLDKCATPKTHVLKICSLLGVIGKQWKLRIWVPVSQATGGLWNPVLLLPLLTVHHEVSRCLCLATPGCCLARASKQWDVIGHSSRAGTKNTMNTV